MSSNRRNSFDELAAKQIREARWKLIKSKILLSGGSIYAGLQLADRNAGSQDDVQVAVAEYRLDPARWDRVTMRTLLRRLKFLLTGK